MYAKLSGAGSTVDVDLERIKTFFFFLCGDDVDSIYTHHYI